MVGRPLADIYPTRDRTRGDVVLSVHGLSRPRVLHDIDLDIFNGEILGICGMAGSGRTELLRALIGADSTSCKSYRLRAEEKRPANPRAAIADGIVLLPEDRKTEGCFLPQSVAFNITVSRLEELLRRGLLSEGRERRTEAGKRRRLLRERCAGGWTSSGVRRRSSAAFIAVDEGSCIRSEHKDLVA